MSPEPLITVLTRLAFGAVATFLAIILWSRTRDTAWMFVVVATIIRYGEVVYTTLEIFGVITAPGVSVAGESLFRLILVNVPTVAIIVAFAIMIARRRLR
jgi:hypothetical protein